MHSLTCRLGLCLLCRCLPLSVVQSALPPSAPYSAQPSLEQADPEIYDLLQREQTRQWKGLELIASEVRRISRSDPPALLRPSDTPAPL